MATMSSSTNEPTMAPRPDPTTEGLAEWLLEQIGEDERDLREDPAWSRWMIKPSDLAARIRLALAECESKRRIVERSLFVVGHGPAVDDVRALDMTTGAMGALGDVLKLLAEPYADRPGYREEWRPGDNDDSEWVHPRTGHGGDCGCPGCNPDW